MKSAAGLVDDFAIPLQAVSGTRCAEGFAFEHEWAWNENRGWAGIDFVSDRAAGDHAVFVGLERDSDWRKPAAAIAFGERGCGVAEIGQRNLRVRAEREFVGGFIRNLRVAADRLIAHVPEFDIGRNRQDKVLAAIFRECIFPAEAHQKFADERAGIESAVAVGGHRWSTIGIGVIDGVGGEGAQVVIGESAFALIEFGQRFFDVPGHFIDGRVDILGEHFIEINFWCSGGGCIDAFGKGNHRLLFVGAEIRAKAFFDRARGGVHLMTIGTALDWRRNIGSGEAGIWSDEDRAVFQDRLCDVALGVFGCVWGDRVECDLIERRLIIRECLWVEAGCGKWPCGALVRFCGTIVITGAARVDFPLKVLDPVSVASDRPVFIILEVEPRGAGFVEVRQGGEIDALIFVGGDERFDRRRGERCFFRYAVGAEEWDVAIIIAICCGLAACDKEVWRGFAIGGDWIDKT